MGTYTLEMKGRLDPSLGGVGPRVIAGQLILGPVSEAVHAENLELRTIHSLSLVPQTGTLVSVAVNRPGTFDNYASVTFVRVAYTSGKIGSVTMTSITSGSKTFQFTGVGE